MAAGRGRNGGSSERGGLAGFRGVGGPSKRTSERDRHAEVMGLPEKVGGYELIFPFNAGNRRGVAVQGVAGRMSPAGSKREEGNV